MDRPIAVSTLQDAALSTPAHVQLVPQRKSVEYCLLHWQMLCGLDTDGLGWPMFRLRDRSGQLALRASRRFRQAEHHSFDATSCV